MFWDPADHPADLPITQLISQLVLQQETDLVIHRVKKSHCHIHSHTVADGGGGGGNTVVVVVAAVAVVEGGHGCQL